MPQTWVITKILYSYWGITNTNNLYILATYVHVRSKYRFWFSAIVKGLIGTSDSATDSINIKRFPVLFEDLVASIQKLDFLEFNFVSKVRMYVYVIATLCNH